MIAPSFVKRSGVLSKGILRSTFGRLSRSLHIATTQRRGRFCSCARINVTKTRVRDTCELSETTNSVAHWHGEECVGVLTEICVSPLRANECGFNISIGIMWDQSYAQIVADVIGSAWKTRTWFPPTVLVVVQTQVQQRATIPVSSVVPS